MKISDLVGESPRPKLLDVLQIDESCLVLGDVEIPFHHAEFINKCIDLAHRWGIKSLLLAGDWIHWGSLAHFFEADKHTQDEITEIENSIAAFVHPFDKIYYISGNHDRRPQITLDRFVGAERITRLVVLPELAEEFKRKVQVSDFYYCYVGDDWQIEHPKTTSSVPANAARTLATIHNRNIAMAHNHLWGMQQTPDGRHWGIEIGCCVDPDRLGYYQYRHNSRPRMQLGALILRKDGDRFYPHLLNPKWTDWEQLKCLNQKRRPMR